MKNNFVNIIYLGNAFETNELICSLRLLALNLFWLDNKAAICSSVGTAGVGSTYIGPVVTVRCNCCIGGSCASIAGDACLLYIIFMRIL